MLPWEMSDSGAVLSHLRPTKEVAKLDIRALREWVRIGQLGRRAFQLPLVARSKMPGLPDRHDIGFGVTAHRGRNCRSNRVRRAPHWVRVQMRIPCRRRRLRVTEQLPDDRQTGRRAGAERSKRMAQVVNADALQARCAAHSGPWLLEVRAWRAIFRSSDHMGVPFNARNVRKHLLGRG